MVSSQIKVVSRVRLVVLDTCQHLLESPGGLPVYLTQKILVGVLEFVFVTSLGEAEAADLGPHFENDPEVHRYSR